MANAVVTVTGNVTPPAVAGKSIGGSGVYFQGVGGTAFDSRTGIQKGINIWDELNQFIAQLTAAWNAGNAAATPALPAVSSQAVIDQLLVMLRDLRRNPPMGERVYAP